LRAGLTGVVHRTPVAKAVPSPMSPAFGQVLSKRAIRDLVQFIAEGD
jgi:hypothetical protein